MEATVDKNGVTLTGEIDGASVTVESVAGIAASGTTVRLSPAESIPTSSTSALQLGGGASIVLGDEDQPKKPITVTFDIPASDTRFDDLGDDVDPVVVAVSTTDPPGSEMLPAEWDASSRTLTATTTHLSSFYNGTVNYSQLRETVSDNVDGFFGQKTDAPSCYGTAATIGAVTYEAAAPAEDVVWPCLENRGGNLAVTLYSNSPLGWIVRTVPPPLERKELTDMSSSSAANSVLYGSLLDSDLGDGTLLYPLGSSEVVFAPPNVPRRIDLRAQAAMTLVDIGMHGGSMVWGGNRAMEVADPFTTVDAVDCMSGGINWDRIRQASDTQAGEISREALDCAGTVGSLAVKSESLDVGAQAAKALGATLTGITSLPKSASLFATTVTGLAGEFNGKNSASVVIRSRGGDTVDLSGVPDEVFSVESISMENRLTGPVQIGRAIGPNRYALSDSVRPNQPPAIDLTYSWTAETTAGEEYNGEHCQVIVSIEGPQSGFEDLKSARCSSGGSSSFSGGDSGQKYLITVPGNYTVRLRDLITGLNSETSFIVEN
ncbi:hypothetical protein [Rhodococcoides kyotonense]|uniref:Uncharacterized protein n=1 Tax=Rhodococcoides kyotonense TaxID=398843 RepID=A0A177YLU3_9NOCA|nr:hypothetical protein [Rhodococcus kyotonensis]OAK56189.1 hypothetical protein A3K89_17050 [Rhodococcus kyotonensis]